MEDDNNLLLEQIIFFVIIIILFSALLFFVVRAGSGAARLEEITAKKVVLLIDSLQPGMSVTFDLSEVYALADKNSFTGALVAIDSERNTVTIRASRGEGYTYSFFSDSSVVWNVDSHTKSLSILV